MVETRTETISMQFLNGVDISFESKNRPHWFYLKIVKSSSRIIGQISRQKNKKKRPQSFVLTKEGLCIFPEKSNSQLRGLWANLVLSFWLKYKVKSNFCSIGQLVRHSSPSWLYTLAGKETHDKRQGMEDIFISGQLYRGMCCYSIRR